MIQVHRYACPNEGEGIEECQGGICRYYEDESYRCDTCNGKGYLLGIDEDEFREAVDKALREIWKNPPKPGIPCFG